MRKRFNILYMHQFAILFFILCFIKTVCELLSSAYQLADVVE